MTWPPKDWKTTAIGIFGFCKTTATFLTGYAAFQHSTEGIKVAAISMFVSQLLQTWIGFLQTDAKP